MEERRAKKIIESPEVKKARLVAWWKAQHDQIQAHRERRKLFVKRARKCIDEVDVEITYSSDKRDYHADMIAEEARNKKRKAMAMNRRKR